MYIVAINVEDCTTMLTEYNSGIRLTAFEQFPSQNYIITLLHATFTLIYHRP